MNELIISGLWTLAALVLGLLVISWFEDNDYPK